MKRGMRMGEDEKLIDILLESKITSMKFIRNSQEDKNQFEEFKKRKYFVLLHKYGLIEFEYTVNKE